MTPVIKAIKKKIQSNSIRFPVWVNADVLKGPVNATRIPLEAKEFLQMANKYIPDATLSLGWMTQFGNDYLKGNVNPFMIISIFIVKSWL